MENSRQRVDGLYALEIRGLANLLNALDVADHAGRLAEKNLNIHIDGLIAEMLILENKLAVAGRDADERDGAALTLAERFEERLSLGLESEHVTLLSLAAPDFHRIHRLLFVVDRPERELTARSFDELGTTVRKTARADIMDRENRISLAERRTRINNALAATLHFGVAALNGVEVESFGVSTRHHRARRAAAETDAHGGTTDLNDKRADLNGLLLNLAVADRAHTAREHDRLMVTAQFARDFAFVRTEETAKLRTAEFIAERRAADRTFGHDLERRRETSREIGKNTLPRLREAGDAEVGNHKAADTRAGARTRASRSFVADFTADAGRGARIRRNRRRMVVGLDLHKLIEIVLLKGVGISLRINREYVSLKASDDGRVILIRRKRIFRTLSVGILNHLKKRLLLTLAVDDELGAENLVAAVLGVNLAEHHKLSVGRITPSRREALSEVLHLRLGNRKSELIVRLANCFDTLSENIKNSAGLRLARLEKIGNILINALGHLIVKSGETLLGERFRGLKADAALYALNRLKIAVMKNIGSLCAPRRNRTLSRSHEEIRIIALAFGVEQYTRTLKLFNRERLIFHFKGINPLRVNLDRTERRIKLGDSVFNRIKSER